MRKNRTNSSGKSLYGKRRKGFTIVELVIVIAVIAILAAVLVPTLSAVVQKAKDSQELQNEKANETNYIASDSTVIGEDFDITKPLTEYYDILSFDAPTLLSTYNQNKERHDGTTTSESYFSQQTTTYYVGDDNEFIFEPIMTARHIVTYEILTLTGFNVAVEVTYNNNTLTATENADCTIGYYDTSSTLYVTFNPETYGFKFDETNATGKSFTLKMTLLDSYLEDGETEYKAIEENYYKNTISPFEMTVTVADGWNVYNALDLGRMCITSTNFSASNYYRGTSLGISYYDYTNKELKTNANLNYSEIWKSFLTSQGETDLTPVKGIYIHSNITITTDDIPQEYIITATEVAAAQSQAGNSYNYNYSDMIGSIRDWSLLYIHYMEDSDFTFNGNLFKLDFSNLKWGMSNINKTGYYYTQNETEQEAGHSTAFAFAGKLTGNQYTAYFNNVESTGNTNGILNATDSDGVNASGSLMFLKNIHTTTNVTNCITKNYLIGYFSEITPDSYNTNVTASDGSTSGTYYGLKISYTKVYNCYNSGVFSWESANNTVDHCEMKRFGGPAVLLVSGDGVKDSYATYSAGGCVVTNSTITSEITGGEAWFTLNGATDINTMISTLASYISTNTSNKSTILNTDNTVNLYSILIDHQYLYSSETVLYGDFSYNSPTVSLHMSNASDTNGDDDEDRAYYINAFMTYQFQNQLTTKSPVFMTDTGTMFFMDTDYKFYDLTTYLTSNKVTKTEVTSLTGNTLYVIYPMGNTVVAFAVGLTTSN